VRTHPQWLRARELVASGRIGQLRSALGFFSYFNNDPSNIRNIPAYGASNPHAAGLRSHLNSRPARTPTRDNLADPEQSTPKILSAASLFIVHVYVRKADGYGLVFLLFPALKQFWSRLYPTTLLKPPTLQHWFLHRLPRNYLRTEPAQKRGLVSRCIRIRRVAHRYPRSAHHQ